MNKFITLIGLAYIQAVVSGQTVSGRVVENGSNYGVPNAHVELFVNGNTTPTTTQTNNQGNFSANPLEIIESTPVELNTLEAAIGPNPGATQTLRFNNPRFVRTDITVYDIATGEEIKKLYSGELNAGTYKIDWDGMNEHNQRVSDGRYGIVINTGLEKKVIKTIINKNAPLSTGIEYTLKEKNNLQKKTELETWQLDSARISGATLEEITITGFTPQTGNYDVGTIGVDGTNVITGYAYDLDTKYSNRTGIPGLEIKLKSIPEKTHTTNNNGTFTFTTTVTGQDSLFINDNVYYNWKHPINISANTEVKAFNDTTGIPMIKRHEEEGLLQYYDPISETWKDSLVTEDLMDFTQNITDVANKQYTTDPSFDYTVPRFKNDTALVYLGRAYAPNNYYADSSLAGLNSLKNEKRYFLETTDSLAAQMHIFYTNANVGNGTNIKFAFDEHGQPYLKNWDINIAGPNSLIGILQPQYVAPVVAHEGEHAVFTSGEHSKQITDLIYLDPLGRYNRGHPTEGSVKEIKARKILSHTEGNPKLLEYYK